MLRLSSSRPARWAAGHRVRAASAAALTTALVGSGGPAWGEPPSEPAQIAAEMTLAALQPNPDALRVTPEVTTTRSRFMPPGAPALTPDGRPMNGLAGVDYRLWMSRGRAAFGVGIGTLAYVQPPPMGGVAGPTTLTGATPTLSVGMRYRMTKESAVFADALGAPGLPPDSNGGYLNTKVGLEWKPATSRFGFDRGALGIHLDSGYRLSVRARRGGLGLYLRGEF
jgi:hypothetical protein